MLNNGIPCRPFSMLNVVLILFICILGHFLVYKSSPQSLEFLLIIVFPYSVELRELEAKLKAGYMNQERAAQLAEKMAMAVDRQVRNYFTNQASVKVKLSS